MAKRLLLLGLVVASAVVAYLTGLHEHLKVEEVRDLVASAGAWGPVVFVLLFGLQGIGLPGIVLLLAAVAVWPPWLAFVLNWLGAQLAGVVGFAFARTIGRDWIAERLPARMRRFERRVVQRGLETVVVVRLVFFLAQGGHWALGLSPVSWRNFLVGSALGFLPWMLLVSFGGPPLFGWLAEQPAELWMVAAAVFIGGTVLWRRRAARRAASEAAIADDPGGSSGAAAAADERAASEV